jgi:hypothetical protein
MAIEIVKEAFEEGRNTETSWSASEAKKNQIKLDTFTSNAKNFSGAKFNELIALEQVCPLTGDVINSFGSRIDAARWIVTNVLKVDDPNGLKALSVTGNMHMCMASGWKSYGYYWRRISKDEQQAKVLTKAKKVGGKALVVFDCRNKCVKESIFASTKEASRSLGIPERTIGDHIGSEKYRGFVFRHFNARQTGKTFADFLEASDFFNLPQSYIKKAVLDARPINNIAITVKKKPKRVIQVCLGKKIVKIAETMTEAGIYLGTDRHTVQRAVKKNDKIGLYRVVTAIAK